MKLFYIFLVLISIPAFAENRSASSDQQTKVDQIVIAIREKLSPSVSSALQEHCGEDCPSFRIDPQFKKVSQGILEHLGFSNPTETPEMPQVQSVTLSILVQDKVPLESREALKQIISHIVANELPVPVTVQLKPLNALSPFLNKRNQADQKIPTTPTTPPTDPRLVWVKETVWPGCLVLLSLIGLTGLALALRNRRLLLRDRLDAVKGHDNPIQQELKAETVSLTPEKSELLKNRSEDLNWLIESSALQEDFKSLSKITKIFQPQDLSSHLKFSNRALKALASLPMSQEKANEEELLKWLKDSLNLAHWQRLEEQNSPLSKLNRIPESQLSQTFLSLTSIQEKAAVLSKIPEEKWPALLSPLSSKERIALGLALSNLESSNSIEHTQLEKELSEELDSILYCPQFGKNNIASLSLYLTDTEGKQLWDELSKNNELSKLKPLNASIDSLIQELPADALLEICTRMDIHTLGILLNQLSHESNRKVLSHLPRTFLERLKTVKSSGSEADQMKARAHLLDAYRKFTAGSMIQ